MAHENPWFLITHSELLAIEERLDTLGTELPAESRHHLDTLAGIIGRVRERQP